MKLEDTLMDRFKTHKGEWISGGAIEKWVQQNTKHTPSYARRLIRLLVEDGKLHQEERVKNGVNHAYYMYNPESTTAPSYKYSYEFDPERNCMVEKRIVV